MPECFFPNQSPDAMRLEMRFSEEVKQLPQASRLVLYEILSSCYPTFVPTEFAVQGELTVARQLGRDIAFPSPIPMVKLCLLLFGYEEWLRRKYCLPGFVEVESGDVVVDCGAYVGGFSLSAARLAKEVHAFEPESANFSCLARNLRDLPNARCNNRGLYCESGIVDLNISASSVEHSLLMPDDGPPIEVRKIEATTLSDYCAAAHLSRLDFVKIEAEGVELEVFGGLRGRRPRKLAIDVSPERNGESPADEFRARLAAGGYAVRQREHVMFARDERQ